ncbi:hypothetical protein NQL31_004916 [Lotmaria passim]
MQPLRPSPPRWSLRAHPQRDTNATSKSPSPFKSLTRTPHSATASTEASRAPLPSPTSSSPAPLSPRQSLVYGPLVSTNVTTIIREESRIPQEADTPAKAAIPLISGSISSTPQREEQRRTRSDSRGGGGGGDNSDRPSSRSPLLSSPSSRQLHTTPTSEELRQLRQTRSLFLCGRGLLSLRHIQHLSEMLSLRFLSVHMNAIKALEAGCLKTHRHLVELDLSANELSDLPGGCWAGLDRLERLNLSSNLLVRLAPGAFSGLGSLQWLSLGFNNLSDIAGLGSVPATAALSYVDLCANRVATVAEVVHALTPHRNDLRELRLASPAALSKNVAAPSPLRDSAESSLASSCWQVQENPLCGSADDGAHPARSAGATAAAASSAPSPPLYVQQLLAFFPHLLVVNGASYGVDPLEMLTPPSALEVKNQDNEEDAAPPDRRTLGSAGAAPAEHVREEVQVKTVDTSDSFARLLAQPLPRLPSTSSSPSSRASSLSSSSSSSLPSTSHCASRRTSRRAARRHHQHAELRNATTPTAISTADSDHHAKIHHHHHHKSSSSRHSTQEDAAVSSPSPPPSSREAAVAATPTPAAPVAVAQSAQHRRPSAPKPRRATLRRCRRSASAATSPPSHDSSAATTAATSSSSLVVPQDSTHSHAQLVRHQSKVPSEAAWPSHARQLHFEREGLQGQRRQPVESEARQQTVATPTHTSAGATASALEPRPRPSFLAAAAAQREVASRDAEVVEKERTLASASDQHHHSSSDGSGGVAVVATRPNKQSMPGLSPSGMTDASDLSLSPVQRVAQGHQHLNSTVEDEGVDAYSVDMSDSDSAGRSPDIVVADSAQQSRSQRWSEVQDGGSTSNSTSSGSGSGSSADCARRPTTPTSTMRCRHTARQTPRRNSFSFPAVSAASHTALQWKPKHISRGTATEPAESAQDMAKEAAVVARVQGEMEARMEQLQEQLALRTATIADLRRHLVLTRGQYMEAQREAQQHQQQLRSQVAALKDELARRGEEAMILERKQQAQLNRAVESVKAEWTRRAEATEQRDAAALAEEKEKWALQVSQLQEEKAQAQQTCSLKTAQLATLERQVRAMEAEMEELRRRAAAQQQQVSAQANLMLAEAEERRHAEAAARDTFTACFASFSFTQSQLARETLHETLLRLRETAEQMKRREAAFHAQAAEYEAALLHAASEAQQLREAQQLPCATDSGNHSEDVAAPAKKQREDAPAAAGSADTDAAHDSALVSTPTPSPTSTPQLPSCTSLVVVPAAKVGHVVAAAATSAPPAPSDADDSVSLYWRDVCARTEAQLRRFEAALSVATTTQQSLANENTRLLRRVESLEADQVVSRQEFSTLTQVAAQEKENLLRTLHTLRADMEKKDGALDALEEEARAKLSEKRQRIAELEEEVDALNAQHTHAAELNVTYRSQLQSAQCSIAELQGELEKEKRERNAAAQQQTVRTPAMEQKLRELSELLATRVAQAHQHELEKRTLIHALTTAREQLVRLQESNTLLAHAEAAAKEQVVRQQMELDAARQQLRETQEATRAKQRATREALSHLMTADAF